MIEREREYRYRKLFGASREQYLDETREHVDWLLAIDRVVP